uniref:Uncharacterized protein n=1 Tax=Haematobia irritans TaxID=7368 RepID=A0A1L8EB12_HAEIR
MEDKMGESDNVTALELQKCKRILHFSDGVMEEFSDTDDEENVDCAELDVDVKSWPLIPRIKYQFYQAGCKFLYGIDYVGEGLASFLGITTPKYFSESDINNTFQDNMYEEKDNNSNWAQSNNTSNMVITSFPSGT